MNKMIIPDAYVKFALNLGIPSETASKVYLAKNSKKSVEPMINELVAAGMDERTARMAVRNSWIQYVRSAQAGLTSNTVQVVEKQTLLDSAKVELEKLIGPLNYPVYAKGKSKGAGSVDVISDLHLPFLDESALAQVLSNPAETLYIVGDIFDSYAASKHRKTVDHITAKEELAQGRALMEMLSTVYRSVRIIKGNHDVRVIRRIQETHPQFLPYVTDPIDIVTLGLTNVQVISTTIAGTSDSTKFGKDYVADFLALEGNVLFSHTETFCGADAPVKLEGWLNDWEHVLKFPESPKLVLHAHTHRLSMTVTPRGRILMATGCLCKVMPYQIEQAGKYVPPTQGYISFNMKDGKVEPRSIEVIYLGL